MYGRILVAADSSDSANRSIEQAVDLADVFEAELYGIPIIDTPRCGDSMLVDLDASVPTGFQRQRIDGVRFGNDPVWRPILGDNSDSLIWTECLSTTWHNYVRVRRSHAWSKL